MISSDVYLKPVLDHAPRLLSLLNRNISSTTYGCFDREFWHYNTADIPCARKQEAVLTLTMLFLIQHERNKYYRSDEVLEYIKAAMIFWTKIQNKNGSFNEWYPNEHSFVVTAFSAYAVSESLLLLKDIIPQEQYSSTIGALKKSGDWLIKRNETRVMNQQTGAVIALLNIYLLTGDNKYLAASEEKILLLKQRQSAEGWFVEYGGPDIGYLSLAIDYLGKYYLKTGNKQVRDIVNRALGFIKNFIQPNLVAGGEYTSRNTEYLIPHGFEIFSTINADALFVAAAVRKSLTASNAFPELFDDRYFTYVGYTWLQAHVDANADLNNKIEEVISNHFNKSCTECYDESGLVILNDENKHLIVNVNKGGAFRFFDKKVEQVYSDSGVLVESKGKWYTSGWLSAKGQKNISEDKITIQGNMWKVPDKTLSTVRYILLRLFQITLGRSAFISLWMKERLRDILITETAPSAIEFKREITLRMNSGALLEISDSVRSKREDISGISVFAKDTHIYVPSSRYYTGTKGPAFQKTFSAPVGKVAIDWNISRDAKTEFKVR
ncbi:MAG: hypothetical protein AB1499_11625 [Nitrospirota bacterium]